MGSRSWHTRPFTTRVVIALTNLSDEYIKWLAETSDGVFRKE
ncbi:hypothetical protein F444_07633 [Phytophthora nicotianae P1976]|uniref:Uncharacterized protein n=2 Tax=Phytophthora nicotianae TaxID=4792 RepID=A0A081AE21_PHYNI|nr:hypothetical protein F444_07633 [Phytophthora nicotianae P1976]